MKQSGSDFSSASERRGKLLSPVLLPVRDDGETVRVVPVAADVRVPPGHSCRRRVILQRNRDVNLQFEEGESALQRPNTNEVGTWCKK